MPIAPMPRKINCILTLAVVSAAMLTHPTTVSTPTATRIGQLVEMPSWLKKRFICEVASCQLSVVSCQKNSGRRILLATDNWQPATRPLFVQNRRDRAAGFTGRSDEGDRIAGLELCD